MAFACGASDKASGNARALESSETKRLFAKQREIVFMDGLKRKTRLETLMREVAETTHKIIKIIARRALKRRSCFRVENCNESDNTDNMVISLR